jgi:hypothetical protein
MPYTFAPKKNWGKVKGLLLAGCVKALVIIEAKK